MAKEGANPELLKQLQKVIKNSHEQFVEDNKTYYNATTNYMGSKWASPDAVKFWESFTQHIGEIEKKSQHAFIALSLAFDNAAYNVLASQGAGSEYTKSPLSYITTEYSWAGTIVEKLNGEVFIEDDAATCMQRSLKNYENALKASYDQVLNAFSNNTGAFISGKYQTVQAAINMVQQMSNIMVGYFSTLYASINHVVQNSVEASLSALCAAEASFGDSVTRGVTLPIGVGGGLPTGLPLPSGTGSGTGGGSSQSSGGSSQTTSKSNSSSQASSGIGDIWESFADLNASAKRGVGSVADGVLDTAGKVLDFQGDVGKTVFNAAGSAVDWVAGEHHKKLGDVFRSAGDAYNSVNDFGGKVLDKAGDVYKGAADLNAKGSEVIGDVGRTASDWIFRDHN